MKGKNDLNTPMRDNPGANRDPDMGKSMGTPKPNMKKGYSAGDIKTNEKDGLSYGVKKDPYGDFGYYDF